MRTRSWLAALAGLPLLIAGVFPAPAASAATAVQVILDGRTLVLDPAPTILDDRTLVPMRGLLEAMGAQVTWDPTTQTVTATKGDRIVRLRIDHRLACLSADCTTAATLDAPARILGDRTFVPARFVSQAMGAQVTWAPDRRAVIVDTTQAPDYQFTSITIPSLTAGQAIQGPVQLQAAGATGAYVQFLLVDPATGVAHIIGQGSDVAGSYTYTPDPTVKGARLVVAAVRDSAGVTRYSDPVSVVLDPHPVVTLTGAKLGDGITGPISLGNSENFVAVSSTIQLFDSSGNAETLGTAGPGDSLTWYPQIGDNGDRWLKATATDVYGNTYDSEFVPVQVMSDYRTVLPGIAEGTVLTGPVTLKPSANYSPESIKYTLDGSVMGWGLKYDWNITQDLNGPHSLQVDVLDGDGTWHTVGPFNITVNVQPYVKFSGVGPNQVVTGATSLKLSSNVTLTAVNYYLSDSTGKTTLLGQGQSFSWTPTAAQAGDRTIWAVATDSTGKTWTTDKVSFRVYLGKIYGKQPLATRDEFKASAVKSSVPIYRESGMSAALQTAQALLETGWGQSVPVDKYTGKISYNLFGIKGTGPAGSIISTTWEEYNGVSYTIDDFFRAYHNPDESWRDHEAFLMGKDRYAPFRAVMSDPVQGAWALRRTGYATDSQYPVKLIKIMKDNNLFTLDDFAF